MYPQQQWTPPPAPTPPQRRTRRPILIAGITGTVVLLAAAGALFATGVIGPNGDPDTGEAKESQPAQPDEPSVNPDDTHYETAAGLCGDLDGSAYEALVPGPGEMTEQVNEDPYGVGGNEVKCEQPFETKADGETDKYAYLTVQVIAYPSALRARHDGYTQYTSIALENVEGEPRWVDGGWEKAQLVEANDTDYGSTVFLAQDDNLALVITLASASSGLDQTATTEAVLATAAEILKACRK